MLSPSISLATNKAVCPNLGYPLNDFLDDYVLTCQARTADRSWSLHILSSCGLSDGLHMAWILTLGAVPPWGIAEVPLST